MLAILSRVCITILLWLLLNNRHEHFFTRNETYFIACPPLAEVQISLIYFPLINHLNEAFFLYRTLVAQVCLSLIVDTLLLFVGLTLFAYYENLGCDPYRSGQVDSTNQVRQLYFGKILEEII